MTGQWQSSLGAQGPFPIHGYFVTLSETAFPAGIRFSQEVVIRSCYALHSILTSRLYRRQSVKLHFSTEVPAHRRHRGTPLAMQRLRSSVAKNLKQPALEGLIRCEAHASNARPCPVRTIRPVRDTPSTTHRRIEHPVVTLPMLPQPPNKLRSLTEPDRAM